VTEVPIIAIYALLTAGITTIVCLTLGRVLARRSRAFARFASGMLLPTFGVVASFVIPAVSPTGPPPNDGPAMVAFAMLSLSAFSLPISLLTSFAVFAVVPTLRGNVGQPTLSGRSLIG
jgi:hypothetical protein